MNIYIPFTYQITSKTTGQHYYGVRYKQGCHPDELWTIYFTSSKYVHELIEKYGEADFDLRIDCTFPDAASARAYEEKFIVENGCVRDPGWLNRGNGGKDFYIEKQSQETIRKRVESRKWYRPTAETIAKRVAKTTGQKRTPEQRKRMSNSQKGHKMPSSVKQKVSERLAANWKDPVYRAKMQKRVNVDGVVYPSMVEAGKAFGIGKNAVGYRCKAKSKRFAAWQLVETK